VGAERADIALEFVAVERGDVVAEDSADQWV
jgi:hypothetical protein